MITSEVPDKEADRLAALYHYDILHSPPEGVFDQLVTLSARLFGLPIAYVLLLDAEQGHLKATHGLPPLSPPPRQELLCAQVVQQEQVVVYHDLAAASHALPASPAVAYALTQQVGFYAGAPLRLPTDDDYILGALCLVDHKPRSFNPHEQAVLEELASLVSLNVAVRHHCRHTLNLGEAYWQHVCGEARDEVHELATLVRYLLARATQVIPVPTDILHLVSRRLVDLRRLLTDRA